MSDKSIQDHAEDSIGETLSSGQSVSQGDMSVNRAPLRDALNILREEENRAARKKGRRPLFRGINMGGIQ